MIRKLLSSYRSVIALNSSGIEELLRLIEKKVPIIAADGAGNRINADYVVGDGDSFKGDGFVQIVDQETTDFEKCIGFAKDKDLLPSLVVGVNGGEIDHVLGNVQALLKHGKDISLFCLDRHEKGCKIGIPLSEGMFRTKVCVGATVSILPFGSCKLSTKGLVWDLTEETLILDGLLAVRNRAEKEMIELKILQGRAFLTVDL